LPEEDLMYEKDIYPLGKYRIKGKVEEQNDVFEFYLIGEDKEGKNNENALDDSFPYDG
jgi:hypothetical protein